MSEVKHHQESVLYNYSTRDLNPTERVKFQYALKGRDGKSGIIALTDSNFLAKSILLVPLKHDDEIQTFFKHWNITYTKRRILILEEVSST